MTTDPPSTAQARGHLRTGEIVRVREERWRVVYVTSHEACTVVELAGADSSNAGVTSRFLLPFEPLDRVAPRRETPRLVRAATWRRAARSLLAGETPSWRSLRAAAGADVSLLAYQLEPALAIVRGLACRVLLADEVGLGKTIQAGLIVAELLARERDARILIVTPAGLRDQWRDELRDRFAIEAARVDAAALARACVNLPAGVNPWSIPSVAITSIDFLKRPDVIRSLEPLAWDLVAFDEAHALGGRSDRALAAELVARRARRVVIVTATPHSGDDGAFERLCALGRLGDEDRLLTFRRSRAEAGVPRRRSMRRLAVRPTQEEARMHQALAAYAARVAREAPSEGAAAARLAMLVLARRASSSASSLARSVERRMVLLREPPGLAGAQLRLPLDDTYVGEDDEPVEELAAPGLRSAPTEQRCLDEILALARAVRVESKVAALCRLLRRAREPVIVFTEYRDTLEHLAAALGVDAARLHGGLTSAERAREVRRFNQGRFSEDSLPVLLATDAASEGLNLQHRCRLVISLDVPWTPLRLEQRIGRVDRLGQSRRVHAITLLARGTAEAFVASRLDDRSIRAEQRAPFDTSGAGTALADEARAEAERLALVRAMTVGRCARTDQVRTQAALVTIGATMMDARGAGVSAGGTVVTGRPGDVQQGEGTRRAGRGDPASPRHRGSRSARQDRPVLATIGRARRAALWLLLRLSFDDAAGATLWTTVNGLAVPITEPIDLYDTAGAAGRCRTRDSTRVATSARAADWRLTRLWFDRIVGDRGLELAAASVRVHDRQLVALRSELQAALTPLLARERAILGRITGDAARLAAPLVDVGLFDRRAVRERDAQRRVAAEAAARADERVRRLEREMRPQPGRRELVLAAAWRR